MTFFFEVRFTIQFVIGLERSSVQFNCSTVEDKGSRFKISELVGNLRLDIAVVKFDSVFDDETILRFEIC